MLFSNIWQPIKPLKILTWISQNSNNDVNSREQIILSNSFSSEEVNPVIVKEVEFTFDSHIPIVRYRPW